MYLNLLFLVPKWFLITHRPAARPNSLAARISKEGRPNFNPRLIFFQ